ncbi:MAG TPA: acetoacetate decarboxylase family protein [Methanospirillum sp.]|uniref:acetoacetate decarboxylase family protein n=1 Tax=Methanospirillum sp. TaxID=45200 RepID=UPI002BD032CC|nr:acetoacetate decarboxylase family protein [Methanospirillum sp.]HOJ96749.1 acetoacetate decarboxylase family protein [Methanospirillum sp.]HOL40885.1 acetoacetate decarboxylase family protein [Methanospirillum sp.]HPP78276.1 acetoacetate decarboxylase family protein [Methanospirillum sp.]
MRIQDKEDGLTHRMPAHIIKYDPTSLGKCPYDDVTLISIMYRTDMQPLRELIPEEFDISEPLIKIGYQKCNAVEWMGGSEYSLITVSTPVRYMGTSEPIDGIFHHVLWENKTAPILGGREEAGMPKVFADIPEYRRLDDSLFINASHEGRTFLEMELKMNRTFSPEELGKMNENNGRIIQFGWRYIPKVGPFPGAALSEATYYPVDNEFLSGSECSGTVQWTELTAQQHPMQYPIIHTLASLPIYEYLGGNFLRGKSWMRMDLAYSLPWEK